MVIERYSHVMHIVSNVTGHIRPGMSAIDVSAGNLPGRHGQRGAQDPRHGNHR